MKNTNLNSVFDFIVKSLEWPNLLEESLKHYSSKEWTFGDKDFYLTAHIEILPHHNGDVLVETANTFYKKITSPNDHNKDVAINIKFGGTQYIDQYNMINFSSICEWQENHQLLNNFAKNLCERISEIATKQLKELVLEKMHEPTNIICGFLNAGHLITDSRTISEIGAIPQYYPDAHPITIKFYDDLDMEQIISEHMPVRISKHDNNILIKKYYNVSISDESKKLSYIIEDGLHLTGQNLLQ